jgi:hypothetical protein
MGGGSPLSDFKKRQAPLAHPMLIETRLDRDQWPGSGAYPAVEAFAFVCSLIQ